MTAQLAPTPVFRAFDGLGLPLFKGQLTTYQAGTLIPQATYIDSTQTTPNTNPIILNARGECALWLDPTKAYKFALTDQFGNNIPGWPVDNIAIGNANPSFSIIPTIDNLFTLGSASFSWANVYVGPNHAPILGTSGNVAYYARTPAEVTAAITPTDLSYGAIPYDIRRYGAAKTFSNATNKAALQSAITACGGEGSTSGGVVIVPADISYGYKVTDLTTYPNFTGITAPVTVIDYGPGNSYAGFPTAYDGDQVRYFFYTPQTTSLGQHDGNGFKVNGAWAPYVAIGNTANLPNPSTGAFDNRRANLFYFNDGVATWSVGQGTQGGIGFTPDQLSNFAIQCYASAIGNYVPYLVERATGNTSYGGGTNVPAASHHFKSVIAGYFQAIFESLVTTAQIFLRTSNGATDDAGLINRAGQLCLNISTQGDAVTVEKATRRVTVAQSLALHEIAIAYSATMVIDAGAGNIQTITPNNGTAFTVNFNPSSAIVGLFVILVIKNTTGGALGALTFGATIKAVNTTQPANTFSRSRIFRCDGTNLVEVAPGSDVAN